MLAYATFSRVWMLTVAPITRGGSYGADQPSLGGQHSAAETVCLLMRWLARAGAMGASTCLTSTRSARWDAIGLLGQPASLLSRNGSGYWGAGVDHRLDLAVAEQYNQQIGHHGRAALRVETSGELFAIELAKRILHNADRPSTTMRRAATTALAACFRGMAPEISEE
jgi:hypothetical protein